MDKKFAIFDLDGTLVDSMSYWSQLAEEYLHSRGVEQVPNHILEAIKPMTMEESADLFRRTFGLDITSSHMVAEMDHMMHHPYRNVIPLKEGVAAYLEGLHQAGTTMCVASATAEPLVELCLSRLGVRHYFQFLLSCETVGVGKTQPDIYLQAAQRMGCTPAETAVYEDAVYAAATAKNAGFYIVGVYDQDASAHWEELQSLSDETIPSFEEA